MNASGRPLALCQTAMRCRGGVNNGRFRVAEIRRERHELRMVNKAPSRLAPTGYFKGNDTPKSALL